MSLPVTAPPPPSLALPTILVKIAVFLIFDKTQNIAITSGGGDV
jgi:hypothetical protein